MKRLTRALLAVAGTALAAVASATAITFGEPDAGAHPYVGLVAVYDDGRFTGLCSGTLVDPDTVLTAAHCLAPSGTRTPDSVRVYFDDTATGFRQYTGGHVASGFTVHPAFDGFATLPNTSDIAVVTLAEPVQLAEYGVLAPVGTLDTVDKHASLTLVGYGAQSSKDALPTALTRRRASAVVVSLGSSKTDGFNVKTSNNPGAGHGTGGNCMGDSGGPVLLGATNVIVAIDSFTITPNCTGVDYDYRVDTAYAQSFLAPLLTSH